MLNISSWGLEGRALLGFIDRQKNLVKRYWAWEIVWVVYNVVNVLSVGYLGAGLGHLGAHRSVADLHRTQLYLLVGSLLWGYLSMVFIEIAFAIDIERWEGTIEYTFMAPVRRVTHLFGVCIFTIVYGLIRSAIVLVIAVALFHLDVSQADFGAAALVLAASIVPLVGMGIIASVMPLLSPEKGQQITMVLEGVMLLVAGVYYPLSVLPLPLQVLGRAVPLTYTLDGMRQSLVFGKGLDAVAGDILVLVALGFVLVPLGLVVFALAERRAKRRGLLKRSG
ncbi:MAG: ABC transporter permease [Candidatus Dormibacteraeota bacterium]|nr:ABC transporter permease [Candidatus Dormibacteraeota bacterium]